MEPRLIWINLLVKLGVAAAVSSSLVRSLEFKSLLFREERTLRQKIYLVLWFGLPITVGVWIRFSAKSFFAGDLSFETVLLLGAIGGRWAGVVGRHIDGPARRCCTASGPLCLSACSADSSPASCAPWRG